MGFWAAIGEYSMNVQELCGVKRINISNFKSEDALQCDFADIRQICHCLAFNRQLSSIVVLSGVMNRCSNVGALIFRHRSVCDFYR